MAETPLDMSKRKVILKPFRRTLEHVERQVFTGPPESARDSVIAAAKALMKGEWQKCCDEILSMKVWNRLPQKDAVMELLVAKIKEEGLRTYLFTYSPHYDSLSLDELCSIFKLEKNVVHSLVSKMMINEELHASWDQPTNAIVMNQVEPTRLQALALQFAEKAHTFVENNEKLLDFRTGGYGFKYDKENKRGGGREWEDRGGQEYRDRGSYRRNDGGNRGGYRGGGGGSWQGRNNRNDDDRTNSYNDNRGGGRRW